MSDDTRPPRARATALTVVRGLAAAVALVALAGGGYWALNCPCEGTPGFVLRGTVQEAPVDDWRFANAVPLCQIQIGIGWRPHSVNLNCMATPEGDLFLSCSRGSQKYWCPRVEPDQPGRLRLGGTVYPVVLNRVTDPATLDAAWSARVGKLQDPAVQRVQPGGMGTPPDAPRPDHWWSFQVRSASAG